MADVDPNARFMKPEGLSLAIMIVSVISLTLSYIVISLRTYVRLSERVYGWDDGLMLAGLGAYTVDVALACHGARVGLGSPNSKLNAFFAVEGTKYLMIWMLLYVIGLAIIKSSVCITFHRIAGNQKKFRIAVYVLLSITIVTFLITFIGILNLCNPVAGNWDKTLVGPGKGQCASMEVMIMLSYISTGATILTDMACAILPGVILWNTKMKLSTKISVGVLLSFASVASITTMIRAPYIEYYRTPTDDLLYYTGFIVLWSNIETGIGCVASSIPTLRRFVRSSKPTLSSTTDIPKHMNHDNKGLVTFGSVPLSGRNGTQPSRTAFRNPTDQGISFASVHTYGDGDWKRLRDPDSDAGSAEVLRAVEKGGIRADYTYEVELSKSPKHGKGERGLIRDGPPQAPGSRDLASQRSNAGLPTRYSKSGC